MKQFLLKKWRHHKRRMLWSAPVFWQIFYSGLMIWFGVIASQGGTFREKSLNWIAQSPYFYCLIGFGIFGFLAAVTKYHTLHVLHALINVFVFSFIFLSYLSGEAFASQTTGTYGVLMFGAIWMAIRIALDRSVIVTWIN